MPFPCRSHNGLIYSGLRFYAVLRSVFLPVKSRKMPPERRCFIRRKAANSRAKDGLLQAERPPFATSKAVFNHKTAKIGHFIGRFPSSVFYFADFFCHVFLLSVVHVYSSVVHEYAALHAAMLVARRAMRPQSLLSVGRLLLFCCKTMLFQIFFNKMCLILEKLRYFCIVLVERA